MNNNVEFISHTIEIFKKFLIGSLTETEFLSQLKIVEKELKKANAPSKSYQYMWFRMYKDDTLVTNMRDVEQYIVHGNNQNRTFFLEQMELAIKENSGFELHFS